MKRGPCAVRAVLVAPPGDTERGGRGRGQKPRSIPRQGAENPNPRTILHSGVFFGMKTAGCGDSHCVLAPAVWMAKVIGVLWPLGPGKNSQAGFSRQRGILLRMYNGCVK